ncbi:MAG: HIT domain-containing protein [Candidatus Eremiobacteraeota bacterium]|nr:HIT domain-containing protein [Candidatus Eremiobacteraeota bacterium]
MPEACIFCDVAAGKTQTPLLYEDEAVVAFADIRPIAPTHILVVPKEHHPTLLDAASEQDEALLGRLLRVAGKLAREGLGKDAGCRIVINNGSTAGQTVYHLHLHLLSGRHFAWPPG